MITGFIGSFQVFDTVYAMTKGGPGEVTKVYYFELYQQGFQFLNMGYASAMAVILFLILMCVTLIQFRIFRNTTYDMS
jgi:multiple sugar transport system permease protein